MCVNVNLPQKARCAACEAIVDQISDYWGAGKPDAVVFFSEYLRDPKFPYQALLIDQLIKKFQIPGEQQGFLQGEHQFALTQDQTLPTGVHVTERENPFKRST